MDNSPIIEPGYLDENDINIAAAKAYSRMGTAYVAFMLIGTLALPLLLAFILIKIVPSLSGSFILSMPLTYFCMYAIGFPIFLLIIKKLKVNIPAQTQEKKLSGLQILALYPVSYAIAGSVNIIVTLVEKYIIGSSGSVNAETLLSSGTPQWVYFIIGCFIAPVMEEIVFRWIPYKKLSGYGVGLYIFWSSIIFGLFHMNLGQSLYAFALGLVFAKITSVTGSIKYTIILHIMVNLTGGVGIGGFVLASGMESIPYIIYALYVFLLLIGGLLLGILMLIKYSKNLKPAKVEHPLTNPKKAFLNPGSIIYYIITIAFIILMFFPDVFS